MSCAPSLTNDEMVEGYIDGFGAEEMDFPDRLTNRGEAYKHGWLNGRDDRIGKPRASFSRLIRRAADAIAKDSAS